MNGNSMKMNLANYEHICKEIPDLEFRIQQERTKIEKLQIKKSECIDRITELENEILSIKKDISHITNTSLIIELENSIKQIKREISEQKRLKSSYCNRMNSFEKYILALNRSIEHVSSIKKEAEEFLESVSDPIVKDAILYKYVKGYSWVDTAAHIPGNTDESLRAACRRYIEKHCPGT